MGISGVLLHVLQPYVGLKMQLCVCVCMCAQIRECMRVNVGGYVSVCVCVGGWVGGCGESTE